MKTFENANGQSFFIRGVMGVEEATDFITGENTGYFALMVEGEPEQISKKVYFELQKLLEEQSSHIQTM